jgi:uncharacterized repeat protein (TIGR03803 family)
MKSLAVDVLASSYWLRAAARPCSPFSQVFPGLPSEEQSNNLTTKELQMTEEKFGKLNVGCLAVLLIALWVTQSQAQTFTTLYNFGSSGDGANPLGDIIMDGAGNLYGTTLSGGSFGQGTVWKLSSSGTETILHSFGSGGDGAAPEAGLVFDKSGNLYGTTVAGGSFGAGSAYKLAADGTESVLYSFGAYGGDGVSPYYSLVFDTHGLLLGTTRFGGKSKNCSQGCGTMFMLDPKTGKERILFNFNGKYGANPDYGRLIITETHQNKKDIGDVYGTTFLGNPNSETRPPYIPGKYWHLGGAFNENCFCWRFAWIYGLPFAHPSGGVTPGKNGNFYGTSYDGGTFSQGAVVKANFTSKTAKAIYNFTGAVDGANPNGGVIRDANSNLYGTAESGGNYGYGAVWQVSSNGSETVLHSFDLTDGANPFDSHLLELSGTLYGITEGGGAYGAGTVFSIQP